MFSTIEHHPEIQDAGNICALKMGQTLENRDRISDEMQIQIHTRSSPNMEQARYFVSFI